MSLESKKRKIEELNRLYEENKSLEENIKDLKFLKVLEKNKSYLDCGNCLFGTLSEKEKENYDKEKMSKTHKEIKRVCPPRTSEKPWKIAPIANCFFCAVEVNLNTEKFSYRAFVYICSNCDYKLRLLGDYCLENNKLNYISAKSYQDEPWSPLSLRKEISEKQKVIREKEATEWAFEYEDRLPLIEISPCGYCGEYKAKMKSLLKELPNVKPSHEPNKAICQDCYFSCPIKNGIRNMNFLERKSVFDMLSHDKNKRTCDDCNFKREHLVERKDGKLFCLDVCAAKNQRTLKAPNDKFCSGCAFQADLPRRGGLEQRKDGHWFHYHCGIAAN